MRLLYFALDNKAFSCHYSRRHYSRTNIIILGTDRNSGSGLAPVPVAFWLVPVPVGLTGTVAHFFSYCIICFMMSYLHHGPPPVPWLDHVHYSSSQTVSRATLQFPYCITCSPPVPWLYHVLPSSSQTVSCATLEFTKCIMTPPLATLGEENYLYFHRLLLLLISH